MIVYANREDTESWRIDRLEKFARVYCMIFGVTEEQLDLMVNSIYDSKGNLTIEWFHAPTARQKEAADSAWEICGEYGVEHVIHPCDASA